MTPKEIPVVGMDHLHAPLVSIREQAAHVIAMLRQGEPVSFRRLIAGIDVRGVVVARFLAVLELYRQLGDRVRAARAARRADAALDGRALE